MDNIKIKKTNDKLEIKKGILKINNIYKYLIFSILFFTLFVFLSFRNENEIVDNLYIYNFIKNTYVIVFFKINFCIFLLLLFLGVTPLFPNLLQEKIVLEEKIIISSINYKKEIEDIDLKEIKVYRFYEANYNFFNQGTYYSKFRDRCMIGFILNNDIEYKWGYALSNEKALEIKKLIENHINNFNKIGRKIIEIKKEIKSIIKRKKELFISNNIKIDIVNDTLLNYLIIFERENYFAQIIVNNEEYGPYRFIYFDMIGGDNPPFDKMLYSWFDSEKTTIQDIIKNIDKALDYFISY